ncbi:MAG TPA: Minf_1886 family protein [Gemmatimonadota bacterium]|nr:Minf_1886 family protein [Gemmatimonadota bacterium]
MGRDEMSASQILAQLRRRDPRYAEEAYLFVLASLHSCLERLDEPRHVSGSELAGSVRDLALERFGPMARTVLEHWGVHATGDLGEIVFLLVECGILIRQDSDSREDFEGLYSFEEAFETGYPWGVVEGERFV